MDSQLLSENGTSHMDRHYFLAPGQEYLISYVSSNGTGNSQVLFQHGTSSIPDVSSYGFTQGSAEPFCPEGADCSIDMSFEQYCTLESSSGTSRHSMYSSPSTVSFSPSQSPYSQQDSQSYAVEQHHSPDHTNGSSSSCTTDVSNNLQYKLKELEKEMLGPDDGDNAESTFAIDALIGPEAWSHLLGIQKCTVKDMLIACAKTITCNEIRLAENLMGELKQMVSVTGEPIERLSAYMMEGLIARLQLSGSAIYKSLKCKEPTSADLLSYMHTMYDICPYFKFGYMSANGAIVEALKGDDYIHIIDFQIAQGSQWITLIQALSARPSGPPQLRITGIDDDFSLYARGGGLEIVGQRLKKIADSFNVPLEFRAAAMSSCEVDVNALGLRAHESLAVNFPYVLHHIADESVTTNNPRDKLLRFIKGLSPKVVTLVEQESNTNTTPFFPRFSETLDFYTAMFESIDVALPRDSKKRINTEQHCIARDIVNIIACEGAERVERHELLGKWKTRFAMAGFRPYPLSTVVNNTIKTLLETYCEHYRLEERDGALFLGWKNRALVTSSAWR